MVCATNLYCHLTKVWVVFDFFSLAQGVHILTVCQSCCYPWSNPSSSKYIASSLSCVPASQPHVQKGKYSLTEHLKDWGMDVLLQGNLPWHKAPQWQNCNRYCGAFSLVSQLDLQLHCRRGSLKSELKHCWDLTQKSDSASKFNFQIQLHIFISVLHRFRGMDRTVCRRVH